MIEPLCTVDEGDLWDLLDASNKTRFADLLQHVEACSHCRDRLEQFRHLHASLESIESAEPPPIPEQIGGYRILRILGEGGMGVVFEAEQDRPHRRVALKVMHPAAVTGKRRLRAFHREIEALGRLNHPSIASIYDAGRAEDGKLYLIMELVEGELVGDYCNPERSLSVRRRVQLVAHITEALRHAHEHDVIHRDLKPSNVMVDGDGVPHVLDFGLARILGHDEGRTITHAQSGDALGTLPYMSPEQLNGIIEDQDGRADVYSVGVMLYELLTGRLPYQESHGVGELMNAMAGIPPTHPSSIAHCVPREVGDIAMKALSIDRARRYVSATELLSDLNRFLRGDAVLARPPSAAYRLRVAARRPEFRLKAGVLSVSTLAALGGFYQFGTSEAREPIQKQTLEISGAQVSYPAYGWTRQYDFSSDGDAVIFAAAGDVFLWTPETEVAREIETVGVAEDWSFWFPRWSPSGRSIALLGRRNVPDSEPGRAFALLELDALTGAVEQFGSMTWSRPISFTWSPSGDALTYGFGEAGLATLGRDGSHEEWPDPGLPARPELGGYSPDGRWLLLSAAGDLWLIASDHHRPAQRITFDSRNRHPTWSADGDWIWFVSSSKQRVRDNDLWRLQVDLGSGRPRGERERMTNYEDHLVEFPLALGSGEMVVGVRKSTHRIWTAGARDFKSGKPITEYHIRAVTKGDEPLLSADGSRVVFSMQTAASRSLCQIGIDGTGLRVIAEDVARGCVFARGFDVSPDGRSVVYSVRRPEGFDLVAQPVSEDGSPRILSTDQEQVWPCWSPTGRWIAYADAHTLNVTTLEEGHRERLAPGVFSWDPWSLQWSRDGLRLAALGYETEADDAAEHTAVFVIEFPSGDWRRVSPIEQAGYKECLHWHPQGDYLTYLCYLSDHGPQQIHLAHRDGRPTELMIDEKGRSEYDGRWSPEGRFFYFQSNDHEVDAQGERMEEIRVYDFAQREVIDSTGILALPYWSHDGGTVVWSQHSKASWFEILHTAQ